MNAVEMLQMLVHTMVHMFDGAPAAVQVLNWIVLAVIAFSWVSLPVLLFQGGRQTRRVRRHRDEARDRGVLSGQDQFLWVFVVPALNEEVTIADAVARLQSTCASHAVFLVVDDGSDDATAEILAGIHDPRLQVLTRVAPSARRGKARALDHAWRHLREQVLRRPEYSSWDEDHVIMTVVDADGRLDPHAPDLVADHFSRPEIGGVQVLVRIYNRRSWLTWGQDVEFSTFGRVFQLGRSGWGSANMGGNGQFNRLSALTSLADEDGPDIEMLPPATAQVPTADEGPWRDRLPRTRTWASGWSRADGDRCRTTTPGWISRA
jgi:1,2-diacylglycerol 3-beta-glucosyltransferase